LYTDVYVHILANERERERERERKGKRNREKQETPFYYIYTYHRNATEVCVLYLARYPHGILLLTNTLITQRNLLAFVPSAYLKTSL